MLLPIAPSDNCLNTIAIINASACDISLLRSKKSKRKNCVKTKEQKKKSFKRKSNEKKTAY